MSTTDDQLASVRAAIVSLEGGAQEVTLADGRRLRYPDIQVLYARETELLVRLREESTLNGLGRFRIGLGAGR